MLELFAISGDVGEAPLRMTQGARYRECRRRDVYLCIGGDQTVDAHFHDDPDLTLICRADLLGVKPVIKVASHLSRLYRQYADDFVRGLRGTFAIILYDHNQRALKAWIDHLGAEQLVFAELTRGLAVSTNIRSLLQAHHRPPPVSLTAIQDYLLYTCIPAPTTIYRGISKLAAGHQLRSRPMASTRAYWDVAYDEQCEPRSERVWANETREAVRSAVALSLTNLDAAQTPGCFLSGGTDSSSVAGFVRQLTCQPPRTFSIGFDEARYNEIQYARIAAKHFSADHHEYFVKAEDIPDLVEKAVQVYDEPFGNSSIVPTYYCARLAAENGITHLLAGDGGDELFGGNARYAADGVFQRYTWIPRLMRKWLVEPSVVRAARWTNLPLFNTTASYVRRSNLPAPDRYFSYSLVYSSQGRELFTKDALDVIDGHDPLVIARTHFNNAPAQSDLNRWLYMDLKITIAANDLRKVMAMSRLAGVTPRFPFLDPTLVEYTGKIPANLKVRGSKLRYLFKRAMAELLPSDIIRKTKHGFGLPYSSWLANSRLLRDFTFETLNSERCRQRGYFRTGLVDWLWSQYESVHRGYYGEILWTLLVFELWHVMHVDRRSREVQHPIAAVGKCN